VELSGAGRNVKLNKIVAVVFVYIKMKKQKLGRSALSVAMLFMPTYAKTVPTRRIITLDIY